jgi:dCTP deaminase
VVLGVAQIRELLEDRSRDTSERLVVTPVLDPESQLKAGNASIDIRLGQHFQVPLRTKLSGLEYLKETYKRDIEEYKDETFVPIGHYFVLHPRQFVLGESLEWVHLPSNIMASVVGRSRWGRDGLVIATATGVHPSFSGVLTLEISNIGEIPIYLYPGLAIAQLFLSLVDKGSSKSPPVPSIFQGQHEARSVTAELPDKAIIEFFRRQFDPWSELAGPAGSGSLPHG